MKFKMILRKSFISALIAAAAVTLFSGDALAAEKEDLFRKTEWDGSKKYIIWAGFPLSPLYNPEDKITFIGCDTPENYDKYMKALRNNESDDVLVGLRSDDRCQLLSNGDSYFIEIKKMDEKSGQVTQVMRDFDGFVDGPFFTKITPDKRLVRTAPYSERIEQNVRDLRKEYLERWLGKPFILENRSFVCRSFYDYREYKYERNLKLKLKIGAELFFVTQSRYINEGRCIELEVGTEAEVVFENRYLDVEYKVLSGKHKGKFVYADKNIR